MATPHTVLGVPQHASKEQVKEAFRKLVWQYHPDKCQPDARIAAEAKFKEVKLAYEAILANEAGYRPPPPGSAPNVQYAEAYWHAHSMDGRVPWGQFAGFETEGAFYRAMMKGGRNNMAILTVMGLVAVPTIAAGAAIIQSFLMDTKSDEDENIGQGLDALRQDTFVVNGQVTQANPWAADNVMKSQRWKEAQARMAAAKGAPAAAAVPADGASSSSSSTS